MAANAVLPHLFLLPSLLLAVLVTLLVHKGTLLQLLGGLMYGLYIAYLVPTIARAIPFPLLLICRSDGDAARGGGEDLLSAPP